MEAPSALETTMMVLMGVFDKYAGIEGRKDTLTKNEVKKLIENELPHFVQGGEKEQVGRMMMELTNDGDQEVDFGEFMCSVAAFTIAGKVLFDQLKQSAQ